MRPVATPHADCAPSASGPAISGFPPKALETSPWQSARSPHRSPPRRGCSQDQLSPSPDAPSRARSSPPRSSVRSDAARLRLLDAPSPTAPQDRRAPQDSLTRLLNRLQKRTHELTFQRIDMRAPVERRPLDPRDLLRKTEVTTPDGRRSHVDRRSLRSAGPLHSAHGSQPPAPVAWARISGNHSAGISLNTCGNASVHHFRTRSLSKIDNPFPSEPNLPFIASAKLKPRSVTSDMQAKRGRDTSAAPLLTAR